MEGYLGYAYTDFSMTGVDDSGNTLQMVSCDEYTAQLYKVMTASEKWLCGYASNSGLYTVSQKAITGEKLMSRKC